MPQKATGGKLARATATAGTRFNGLPVKDAKKDLFLDITKQDVRLSTAADPRNCAAAVTCRRQLQATDAAVYRAVAYIKHDGHYVRYLVPTALRAQLSVIDQGGAFYPTTYILKKVTKSRRLGKATGIKSPGWVRPHKRKKQHAVEVSPLMRPSAPR